MDVRSTRLSRRALWLALAVGLTLGACGRNTPKRRSISAGPTSGLLEWATGGDWRPAADRARDQWRHPLQTLSFWGLKPGQTVVEFWPGIGWYTDILAPYLSRSGGKLIAAQFQGGPGGDPAEAQILDAYRKKLAARPPLYGEVRITAFGPTSGPVAEPGSVDLAIFQNVHSWMMGGVADKAFRDAFAALKPGGVLGVEENRAAPGGVQDVLATDGYVQEDFVKQLAAEAGFRFDSSSEVNANPKDDRNHPFGVWTLPPTRQSAPSGKPDDPQFDHSKYDAIGESDRMTLRFVKP